MNPHIRVTPMTTEHAIREWPVLEGIMSKVLDYACGRYDMGDVKRRVESGDALVLLVWDPDEKIIYATLLAEAEIYPKKKVFSLSILAGEDLSEWAHLYPVVKHIARKLGYDQIDIVGRKGWGRFIPTATQVSSCFTEDL